MQIVLILFVLGGACGAALPPPVPTPTGTSANCTYKNETYTPGVFRPTPCEYCECDSGHAFCAIIDCFPAICVDAVREDDQCCARCPNGDNCAHEGHIIKYGESYYPDANTVCSCPRARFHFGYGGTDGTVAVCAPVVQPPVTPPP